MLKIVVLLIATVQLQVVTSSGGGALDYEKQGEWGGDCNKKGSMKQSPVNVIIPKESTAATGKLVKLSDDAENTDASNLNNENTIKISFSKTITYKIPGLSNTEGKVEQLHLHWGNKNSEGSEHLLDGDRFSAEAHLVTSYKDGANLAVVARFFEVGEENGEIKKMIDSANSDSEDDREISQFNLTALYPSDISQVITYSGSLTTPNCTEIVHWVIVPERLTVSSDQLQTLREVHLGDGSRAAKTFNWRIEQKLNDRSFTSYKSSSSTLLPSSLLLILAIVF